MGAAAGVGLFLVVLVLVVVDRWSGGGGEVRPVVVADDEGGVKGGVKGGLPLTEDEVRGVMEVPERLDFGESVGTVVPVVEVEGGADAGDLGPVGEEADLDVDPSGVDILNRASGLMVEAGSGRFKGSLTQWFGAGPGRVEVQVDVLGGFSGPDLKGYALGHERLSLGGWDVVRSGDDLYVRDKATGFWTREYVGMEGGSGGWLLLNGFEFQESVFRSLRVEERGIGAERVYLVSGVVAGAGLGDSLGLGGSDVPGYTWSVEFAVGAVDYGVRSVLGVLENPDGLTEARLGLVFWDFGGELDIVAPDEGLVYGVSCEEALVFVMREIGLDGAGLSREEAVARVRAETPGCGVGEWFPGVGSGEGLVSP